MIDLKKDPRYQAFRILQLTFIIIPILAGADKFFYLISNWSNFIAPFAIQLINYQDRVFMMTVGALEILVGIGVLFKPKLFAYIIAGWFCIIIIDLFMTGQHFDIALHDIGLLMAVIALAKLSPRT